MVIAKRAMRGASVSVVLSIILLVVLVLRFALALGTDYMQFMTVRTVINDIAEAPGAAQRSVGELRQEFDRRLTINSVRAVTPDNLTFDQDGSGRHIILSYESRRPYLGNVDVVANFSYRAILTP